MGHFYHLHKLFGLQSVPLPQAADYVNDTRLGFFPPSLWFSPQELCEATVCYWRVKLLLLCGF